MADRASRVVDPATDPAVAACPLCGEDNRCRAGAPDCWCLTTEFAAGVLDRVPEADRGRVCVCARCASGLEAVDHAGG